MKEQWIDRLQRQMETLETKAPEGLLDDIKSEMARRGLTPNASARRKSRIVPLWAVRTVACAAVLLACIWLGTTYYRQLSTPNTNTIAKTGGAAPSTTANTASNDNIEPQETSHIAQAFTTIRHAIGNLSRQENEQLLAIATPTTKEEVVNNNLTTPSASSESGQEGAANAEKKAEKQPRHYQNTDYTPSYLSNQHRQNQGRIEIGAHYQGSNANGNARNGLLYAAASPNGAQQEPIVLASSPTLGVSMVPPAEEAHHRQPVKVGVSVRYHLTERLALQSGLNYSYHSSGFTTGDQTTEQRLNFVGVPVAASYDVWGNRHINLYATAGGEVEKMVKGKQTTKVGDKQTEANVKMSQLQLSATAAVGVEYKATEKLRIYAEPGVAYHFDNHSNVQTIYSDKPCTFNLSLGLRYDL